MVGRLRVRRALVVVLVLLAAQFGMVAAPAHACACGLLVPEAGRQAQVARETSVVRWDGEEEQIVMRLTVRGDSPRLGWVMPVPGPATVDLVDPGLFEQLAAETAPERRTRRHFWPKDGDWPLVSGDGTGEVAVPSTGPDGDGIENGGGVSVERRQRLGPFEVTQLSATDPAALDAWLNDRGFTPPPGLETVLQPYLRAGWRYVAVRLAPELPGSALRGVLDPLRVTFRTGRPVYPMRLSRLSDLPQSLSLYVLARHRMEPVSAIGGSRPRVTYAGRVRDASGALAEFADGTPYLTAIGQEFPEPALIDGDHMLRRAASDAPFRQVIYEDRLREIGGIPAWVVTTVGGGLAGASAAALLTVRRARRHPAGASSDTPVDDTGGTDERHTHE
jgi:hypothetical protein